MNNNVHIIPRTSDSTTHTNGFEAGRKYKAKRVGDGYMVTLGDRRERFIPADGDGGGHLQWRKPGVSSEAKTSGHFEIIIGDEDE